jgi:hypothetical protein
MECESLLSLFPRKLASVPACVVVKTEVRRPYMRAAGERRGPVPNIFPKP